MTPLAAILKWLPFGSQVQKAVDEMLSTYGNEDMYLRVGLLDMGSVLLRYPESLKGKQKEN